MEVLAYLILYSAWLVFSTSLVMVAVIGLSSLIRPVLGRPAPPTGRLRRVTIVLVAAGIVGTSYAPAFVIIAPLYSGWMVWEWFVTLSVRGPGEIPWLFAGIAFAEGSLLWLYVSGSLGRWIAAARRKPLAKRGVPWNG